MYSDVCEIRDVWCAAFLLTQGMELLGVMPTDNRHSRFLFKNPGDQAFAMMRAFRDGTDVMVNAVQFRQAYNELFGRSKDALRLEYGYGNYENRRAA